MKKPEYFDFTPVATISEEFGGHLLKRLLCYLTCHVWGHHGKIAAPNKFRYLDAYDGCDLAPRTYFKVGKSNADNQFLYE